MERLSPGFARAAIIFACAMGLSVSVSSILLGSFSVFFGPLGDHFGWSRGQLSLAFSLSGLAIALASPPVGRLVASHGVRKVLLVAIPAFAFAIAIAPYVVTSYAGLLLWAMVAAAIGAAANTFVYLSVLPAWFPNRLGFALGLAMTGIGVGHAAAPVVSQRLIDLYGWQGAYQALGLISLVVALPIVLLFVRPPASSEADEAKDELAAPQAPGAALPSWADRRLLLFGCAFFLIAMCASGSAVHAIPILKDKGLGAAEAASYGAMGGIAVFVTRLLTGYLLDRVPVRYVATFNCLCAALTPMVLLGSSDLSVAVFAPLLAGMAIGAEGDLMPYAIKKVFGLDFYPQIYSRLFMFFNLGVLMGPLIMGLTFDRFSNYDPILFMLSGAMIAALVAFLAAIRHSKNALLSNAATV